MKKLLYIALMSSVFMACDDRTEELNTPIKVAIEVPASTLFLNGMRNTFDNMESSNVNNNPFRLYAQYMSQCTYPEESQYNMTREIPYYFWRGIYRDALADLNAAKVILEDELETADEVFKPGLRNKLACTQIMMDYNYAVLVDTYGDVPYSEALDADNISPKYDDAAGIYDQVLASLDAAIALIDDTEGGFEFIQDPVFGGNMSNWMTFANTLKLRMGMRLADVNASKSIQVVNAALAAGVISSNAENVSITYGSSSPNTNPLYASLVLSGRKDFVLSNTIVDLMGENLDPRIYVWGDNAPFNFGYPTDANNTRQDSTTSADFASMIIWDDVNGNDSTVYIEGVYTFLQADTIKNPRYFQGGIYGTANSYNSNTKLGDLQHSAALPGTIMSYAEVEFLMAEMAERGGYNVSGTAESHYNAGIQASFDQWGASGASGYMAQAGVAYSTAPGTWQQKIGTQMWLALYNNGHEGWTTWRRLDMDFFNVPDGLTAGDIPVRFPYPLREGSQNGTNYSAAGAKIGGDAASTKVFWDRN